MILVQNTVGIMNKIAVKNWVSKNWAGKLHVEWMTSCICSLLPEASCSTCQILASQTWRTGDVRVPLLYPKLVTSSTVDWWCITVMMMMRGAELCTMSVLPESCFFHIALLQSCFWCTLLVTVLLRFTFTFLITHTRVNMLRKENLLKTLGSASLSKRFKENLLMVDAGLAVDGSSVPEKKNCWLSRGPMRA